MSTIQSAPHPLHVHLTTPIPPSTASTLLSNYLQRASIDPSYRPDSTLSNRGDGPQSNSGGTGNVNLTLYHLDRILKGINGEDLGIGKAEEILGKIEDEGEGATKFEDQGFGKPERRGAKNKGGPSQRLTSVPVITTEAEQQLQQQQQQKDGTTASEWQDREAFEREQDIEQGEVGDRDAAAVPDVQAADEMDIDDTGVRTDYDVAATQAIEEIMPKKELSAKEKEERKKAKKLRLKEERRAKQG